MKFTVTTESEIAERDFDYIKAITTTDGEISSTQAFELARIIGWYAQELSAKEASQTIEVGKMYFYRHKRGVSYVVPVAIDEGRVFVVYCKNNGEVCVDPYSMNTALMTKFYEPQSLRAYKKMSEPIGLSAALTKMLAYCGNEAENFHFQSFFHFSIDTPTAEIERWIKSFESIEASTN